MPTVDKKASIVELKKLLQAEEEKLAKVKKEIISRKKETEKGIKYEMNNQGQTVRIFNNKELKELRRCFKEVVEKSCKSEKITKSDYEQFTGDDSKEEFDLLDTNHDGFISSNDFIAFLQQDPSSYPSSAGQYLQQEVVSKSTYLQARFADSFNRFSKPYLSDESLKANTNITYGSYNDSNPTEMQVKVRPCTLQQHHKFVKVLDTDICKWQSDNIIRAGIMLKSNKDFDTIAARSVFEVKDETSAKALVEFLNEWLSEIVMDKDMYYRKNPYKGYDFEEELKHSSEQEEIEKILNEMGIIDEGKHVINKPLFLKHARMLLNTEMFVEKDGDIETRKGKTSQDDKIAKGILNCQHSPRDVCKLVRAHSEGKNIIIDGKLLLKSGENNSNKLTYILRRLHSETDLNIGIGGDLYSHLKDVLNCDAKMFEATKWGIKIRGNVKKSSHTTRIPIKHHKYGGFNRSNALGWFIKDLSIDVEFQNLLSTVDELVNFHVEETRHTLEANSGTAYEWGDYENNQLNYVADWAKFIIRAVEERLRLSNKIFHRPLSKFLRLIEDVGLDKMSDTISGAKLTSINISTESCIFTSSFSSNVAPFAALPSKEMRENFKLGKTLCNVPQEFINERKEREEELKDEAKMRALAESFAPAMDYLESEKGTTAMAKKEGLVSLSMLVKEMTGRGKGWLTSFLFDTPAEVDDLNYDTDSSS